MDSLIAAPEQPRRAAARRGPWTARLRHGWLLEIGSGLAVFFTYDNLRDVLTGTSAAALVNARRVVDVERVVGLYHERSIQATFLDWGPFVSFWNIYYGTIHFVMPVLALVVMWRKAPARYVRWRNTFVFMLGFALLGFWLFPLAPPRLMPSSYGFVDTATQYFGIGRKPQIVLAANGQPVAAARNAFGNLYAAMPSLHVGWATWSSLALLPLARRRWLRALLVAYPLSTIFGIVVTGNHWLLDAFGGWVVLGLGYASARIVERMQHTPPVIELR